MHVQTPILGQTPITVIGKNLGTPLLVFFSTKKKCVCCSEKVIVAVHHFDHDRLNNDPRNLVPLCPTHHQYVHSRHAHLVLPKIRDYVREFRRKYKALRVA